jgi:hypothetical protein
MLVSKDYKDSSFWYFNQKGSFTTTTGIPKRIGDYLIQEELITFAFLKDRFVWSLTEKGMQKAEKLLTVEAPKEEPTSLLADTHGTGKIDEHKLTEAISHLFDLRPNGIIRMLDLKRPIYMPTAAYGHFGKASLPWEQLNTDIFTALQKL